MRDIIERLEEKVAEYNRELKENSKSEDQLTVKVECFVKGPVTVKTSYIRQVDPNHDLLEGRFQRTYPLGQITTTTVPISHRQIKELVYPGLLPLQEGDQLMAYVLKGEEKREKISPFEEKRWPIYLVEREFKESELVRKIEKVKFGKIVAMYECEDK